MYRMFVGWLVCILPFKHLFQAGTFKLLDYVIFTGKDFERILDNRPLLHGKFQENMFTSHPHPKNFTTSYLSENTTIVEL